MTIMNDSKQAGRHGAGAISLPYIAGRERRDWGCWPGLLKPHSLPTVSHLQRPHLLILPKQCHQLETRHSII